MRINKKLYDYVPLIPTIHKQPIDFTKKETKEYYEWFMIHIDERSDYLRNRVARDLHVPLELLNYSFYSLKLIWRWFLSVADLDQTSGLGLSVFSYYVVRDIGMYVGKVFTKNYSIITWTVKTKPKNYISVNEPLLMGFIDDNPSYPKPFHPDFEPIGCVYSCALNMIDKTCHEDDLYNMCMKFCSWIPK